MLELFTGHFKIHRGFASRSDCLHVRYGRRAVHVTGPHSKSVQRRISRSAPKCVNEIRGRDEGQTGEHDDQQMVAPTRYTL